MGSNGGDEPCHGLVIGRGPDRTSVYTIGRGPDGVLGTEDDDTETAHSGGVPANEVLIPGKYAPREGELFDIRVEGRPAGSGNAARHIQAVTTYCYPFQ